MKFVEYDNDGNILSYGMRSGQSIATLQLTSRNITAVNELRRGMDITHKVTLIHINGKDVPMIELKGKDL